MPLNDRDTLTPFQLPPESKLWPEVQPLAKEYRKLVGDRRAAQQQLGQLEDAHVRAVESDKVAYAQALREGKPDPGNKAVEKLNKERANTRRTIESLEVAILEVEAELEDAIEAQKAGQSERIQAEIEEACVVYAAAIDELAVARQSLAEIVAMRHFLKEFPERGYKPAGWPVFKLQAPSGDPYDFGRVSDALHNEIEVIQAPPRDASVAEPAGLPVEYLHEVDSEWNDRYGDWSPGTGTGLDRRIRQQAGARTAA